MKIEEYKIIHNVKIISYPGLPGLSAGAVVFSVTCHRVMPAAGSRYKVERYFNKEVHEAGILAPAEGFQEKLIKIEVREDLFTGLAILVRDRKGTEVALSWGEVFYRNPAGIIVVTSAEPVMPHHDCKACHGEVFLNPSGKRIMIADRIDNHPIKKGGRFFLVQPADLMADRDVKSIQNIYVIQVR